MKHLKIIEKFLSGNKGTIVAFGDSLTYGWMVNKGYLDFLKELLCYKYPSAVIEIINCGIPGDTALDGLHRIKRDVTAKQADLVLIQFGLNDMITGFSEEDFLENLEKIIQEIKRSMDTEIALLTSVYFNMPVEYSQALRFYRIINQLGEKYSLSVANVHEYMHNKIKDKIDLYSLFQNDCIHPTEKGYKLFAEGVIKIFI